MNKGDSIVIVYGKGFFRDISQPIFILFTGQVGTAGTRYEGFWEHERGILWPL